MRLQWALRDRVDRARLDAERARLYQTIMIEPPTAAELDLRQIHFLMGAHAEAISARPWAA